MPIYRYEYTDSDGGTFEEFQKMDEPALDEHAGRPCTRVVATFNPRTRFGKGNNAKPIEMFSIALSGDGDIQAFRERNPGATISADRKDPLYGVPIAHSRSEKLRILDREGFQEK